MKHLPSWLECRFLIDSSAIQLITHHRGFIVCHMDANLVGPSCLDADICKTPSVGKGFANMPTCGCKFTMQRPNRHFLSHHRMSTDGHHYPAFRGLRGSQQQSLIALPDFPLFKISHQGPEHHLCFSDKHDTRRVLIQSMNNSGPSSISIRQTAAMIGQTMRKCTAVMPGSWMHHRSWRLADNQQMLIFVKNRKGDLFRHKLRWLRGRKNHADNIVCLQAIP